MAGHERRDRLRVDATERPGWTSAEGELPRVGEIVFCREGEAEVVRVLGRNSDGSRLLELHLIRGPETPYFAASSNVLRRTADGQGEAWMGTGSTAAPTEILGRSTSEPSDEEGS